MPYAIDMDRLDRRRPAPRRRQAGRDRARREGRLPQEPRRPLRAPPDLGRHPGRPRRAAGRDRQHASPATPRKGDGRPQVVETVLIHQADFATFDPLVMKENGHGSSSDATMSKTIVEKILAAHSGGRRPPRRRSSTSPSTSAWRATSAAPTSSRTSAEHGLGVADPARTFFTFDCNPGGSDQKYAANQQACRVFAREQRRPGLRHRRAASARTSPSTRGWSCPGAPSSPPTPTPTSSAPSAPSARAWATTTSPHAFAHGQGLVQGARDRCSVVLEGTPRAGGHRQGRGPRGSSATLRRQRPARRAPRSSTASAVDGLDLAGRITIASLATEMGAIILLFPPDGAVLDWCRRARRPPVEAVAPTRTRTTRETVEIDIGGLGPAHLPPRPPRGRGPGPDVARAEDRLGLHRLLHQRPDRGPATWPREVLRGRRVAPGVVLKIVPATDAIWRAALDGGLLDVFKDAGALVGNAGCAGCAAGQVGQNGPGEVTVCTGNRNFAGKQGKGEVWLASPRRRRGVGGRGHHHHRRRDPRPSRPSSPREPPRRRPVRPPGIRGPRRAADPRPRPRLGRATRTTSTPT